MALVACLLTVSSASAQTHPVLSLSAGTGGPALAFSQPLTDLTISPGRTPDSTNPFENVPFDGRWLDSLGPLPSQASSWDSSAALGYAHAPATGAPVTNSFAYGPTSLPPE